MMAVKEQIDWVNNMIGATNLVLHSEYYHHRDTIGAIKELVNRTQGAPRYQLEQMLDKYKFEMEVLLEEMVLRKMAEC